MRGEPPVAPGVAPAASGVVVKVPGRRPAVDFAAGPLAVSGLTGFSGFSQVGAPRWAPVDRRTVVDQLGSR
jgi:hypothetical protein